MTKNVKKTTAVVREPQPRPRRDVSHVSWRIWAGLWRALSAVINLAGRRVTH
ncbi:hypothetical protein [Lentzea tibetensis]|uniref:hypothetical protein n=1 Tax=Lentzea tibetensis TaxID=2591470 RepID=UPI001648412E|nr:hypothetical protein [Lentzea tibetensis]